MFLVSPLQRVGLSCFCLAVGYQNCVCFLSLQGVLTPSSHAPLHSVLVGLHLLSPLHCHQSEACCSVLHIPWPCLPPWPLAFSFSLLLTLRLSLTGYYTLLLLSLSSSLFQGETTQCSFEVSKCTAAQGPGSPVAGMCTPPGCEVQPEAYCPADSPHPSICLSTCCNVPPSVQSLSWLWHRGTAWAWPLPGQSFRGPGYCQAIQCPVRVT